MKTDATLRYHNIFFLVWMNCLDFAMNEWNVLQSIEICFWNIKLAENDDNRLVLGCFSYTIDYSQIMCPYNT